MIQGDNFTPCPLPPPELIQQLNPLYPLEREGTWIDGWVLGFCWVVVIKWMVG